MPRQAGSVRGLPAGPAWSYARRRAEESVRERFWVVPSLLLVAGVVLAVLTAAAEDLGVPANWQRGLPVEADAAEGILETIAASMLTFVGVVFTITLVALQLASAQLSPRVIRTFVRSAVTKVAFGTFLATFAFAIVALVLDETLATEAARGRAVITGSLLVLASLGIFLVYVTTTMRLLQVSWVVAAVAEETRQAIRANLPPASDYREAAPPRLVDDPVPVHVPGERTQSAGVYGVVLSVDRSRLLRLAAEHGCVVELTARLGDYVSPGGRLMVVHGGQAPPHTTLVACVHLGRDRTLFQDHAFGVRQLVDVAVQALSPALNQPTTAVQVLDRLEDLLLRAASRPEPTGLWMDGAGTVRLVERPHRWPDLLDLAVEEILVYGAGSPQVVRRMQAMLDRLTVEVPAELALPVRRRRAELAAAGQSRPEGPRPGGGHDRGHAQPAEEAGAGGWT